MPETPPPPPKPPHLDIDQIRVHLHDNLADLASVVRFGGANDRANRVNAFATTVIALAACKELDN